MRWWGSGVGSAWYQPASVPKLHGHNKVRGPSSPSFRLQSKTREKETREERRCREGRGLACITLRIISKVKILVKT